MRFKEWLQLDEARFKGLKRQFLNDHPHMPTYVANDLYNNRIGWGMKNMVSPTSSALAPTQPFKPDSGYFRNSGSPTPSDAPSKIINQQGLTDIRWIADPQVINVTPLDFDEQTLSIMIKRRFGFEPIPGIWNDAQRMAQQRQLMQQRGAENEPIIVVYSNRTKKFKLLEGWHRTMSYLVFDGDMSKGAPPDQIQMLKAGNLDELDLSRWTKVPMQAYVGIETSAQKPTQIQSRITAA